MIKTIDTLRRALMRRGILPGFSGVVLYDGPSRIDGAPIVAIACRIADASVNSKTGAMVQTFIMRRDIAPHKALKTGDDSSVCGDCKLRPIYKGATRCYVRVYQAPLSVWNAFHRGRYAVPGVDFDAALLSALFEGLAFRIAPTLATESVCPASKEAGQRTQCDTCGLCQGAKISARNIVIADHGLMDSRRRAVA